MAGVKRQLRWSSHDYVSAPAAISSLLIFCFVSYFRSLLAETSKSSFPSNDTFRRLSVRPSVMQHIAAKSDAYCSKSV